MIITLNKKSDTTLIKDRYEIDERFIKGENEVDSADYVGIEIPKDTIVVYELDTTNKSKAQLEEEVIEYVDNAISNSLEQYKMMMTSDEYNDILRMMRTKRNQIIKSLVFQIRNIEEINDEADREWTPDEIADIFGVKV